MTKSEAVQIVETARRQLRKRRKKLLSDSDEWQDITRSMAALDRVAVAIDVGFEEKPEPQGPARAC